MKRHKNICKIANASLALFVSVSPITHTMETPMKELRDHNYYQHELQRLEESTRRIHAEVDRILKKFRHNMQEYRKYTRGTGTTPADKLKQIQINLAAYQNNPTPDLKNEIATDLNHLIRSNELKDGEKEEADKIAKAIDDEYLDGVRSDFTKYQSDPAPVLKLKLKHKIIMGLDHLMRSNELKDGGKGEAIKIAKAVGAHNLKVRLDAYQDAYHQRDRGMGNINVLPSELIHQIIEKVLEGGRSTDIKPLLQTSKGFSLSLLSQPISLNLRPFSKIVTDQVLAQIAELFPMMRRLDLAWCQRITDAGLAHLEGLTQLTKLNLGNTNIAGAGLEYLKGLTQLTKLNLGNTPIRDAGLVHLKGLTQLTHLDLSGCSEITDEGLEHLKGLTKLTSLDLYDCRDITDAGLVHLKGLPQLTYLNLYDCRSITDAAVQELQKALPNLRITR